jgi:hypothetical protein
VTSVDSFPNQIRSRPGSEAMSRSSGLRCSNSAFCQRQGLEGEFSVKTHVLLCCSLHYSMKHMNILQIFESVYEAFIVFVSACVLHFFCVSYVLYVSVTACVFNCFFFLYVCVFCVVSLPVRGVSVPVCPLQCLFRTAQHSKTLTSLHV